jgi:hypothetical protein
MSWLRTIFGILAGLGFLGIVVQLMGCTLLPSGNYDCSLSTWIPVQYQAVGAMALMILGGLFKMFGQGGTPLQNMFNKSVVVTPEIQKGTVTENQVKAG